MAAISRMRERIFGVSAGILLLTLLACDVREGWIVLRNDTTRNIVSLSLEPCGGPVPGPNRLDAPIPPGAAESFLVGFGCYDVFITTEDAIPGEWRVTIRGSQRRVILYAQDPPLAGGSLHPLPR